jgi:hypothetical protein
MILVNGNVKHYFGKKSRRGDFLTELSPPSSRTARSADPGPHALLVAARRKLATTYSAVFDYRNDVEI